MRIGRIVLALVLGGPLLVTLSAYIGLIVDGTVPPPNWSLIAATINASTVTITQIVVALGLIAIGLLAVLAPIIFAVRSNDLMTVLVSLAMTGGAVALVFVSRSVMDQISALIIFLANITLSGIVYAAHRIAPNK